MSNLNNEGKSFETDFLTKFLQHYDARNYTRYQDAHWFYFVPKDVTGQVLPDGGFKGHISAQFQDILSVLEVALPIIINSKCSFKVAVSSRQVTNLIDLHSSITEANKFLTFYPATITEFRSLMFTLFNALRPFKAPSIYTDQQCGVGHPLHFRFGAFVSHSRWNAQHSALEYFFHYNGQEYVDDRSQGFHLPTDVPSPFSEVEEEKLGFFDDSLPADSPLSEYTFERDLQDRNMGSVFTARNSLNQKVIIKTANPYVHGPAEHPTAQDTLKNEYTLLCRLASTECTPKPLAYFSVLGTDFLVEEYITGKTINRDLSVDYPPLQVAKAVVQTVRRVHQERVTIGDLSNNNFIYDGKRAYLIDLGDSALTAAHHAAPLRYYTPRYALPPTRQARQSLANDAFALFATCAVVFLGNPLSYPDTANEAFFDLRAQLHTAESLGILSTNNTHFLLGLLQNAFPAIASKSVSGSAAFSTGVLTDTFDRVLPVTVAGYAHLVHQKPTISGRYWTSNAFAETVSPLGIQHGIAGMLGVIDALSPDQLSTGRILQINQDFAPFIERETDNSYLFGLSGYAWALHSINRERADSHLASVVAALLNKAVLLPTTKDDYALGAAGVVATLVYCADSDDTTVQLVKLADKLASTVHSFTAMINHQLMPSWQDLGFAHGLGGMVFALLSASIRLHRPDQQRMAQDGLLVLRKKLDLLLVIQHHQRYMDLSWCQGLAGIAEALLLVDALIDDATPDEARLSKIEDRLIGGYYSLNDAVCHGKASVMNALLDHQMLAPGTWHHEKALTRLMQAQLLNGGVVDHGYQFTDESGIGHLLDYGVGQSGTLYTVARYFSGQPHLFTPTQAEMARLARQGD
ncbi:lanthionine synthetase LanC family protein [Schleiferilactobacillus shenzhenensis]|uniref:non-specific serine/threonine protein kinase n=1 Tax=Schleiferilactobacillus shenzhenensis LY-73 TaxID=1231336 RepID=U4TNA2_9LACO|nr:lanthionine synthetase LanC family protein [Schleiferilactobacillus shenzhenensis]ERL65709.1 hypothetical protein L248_2395 [Schleiferilactobacillus shenzhenensis LY-73]